MGPRALGALLAVLAAIAFVLSIASSAWWSGHPVVDGREIHAKDVHVGLLGATGCNTGGEGRCEDVPTGSGVKVAGVVELGLLGVASLLALALAVSAWAIGDRRKRLAGVTIAAAVVAGVGGIAVLALGPDIQASQRVTVPLGWGTLMFVGGLVSVIAASVVTRKLEPEPLRLHSPHPQPAGPPFDVRDMLRDQGGLRPAALGPEPMIGRPSLQHMHVHPGGDPMQGSAGAPSGPLIGNAPQLRPLYEIEGYAAPMPTPSTALPVRPPTPMPREMIGALTGQVTPPPERAKQPSSGPPLPPANPALPFAETAMALPSAASVLGAERSKPASLPPPLRGKPASLPPPVRAGSNSVPPPVRSNSVPPPVRAGSNSVPPPVRAASNSVPPLPAGAPRTKMTSAVPPPRPDIDRNPIEPPSRDSSRRLRTQPGPGTDPAARALTGQAALGRASTPLIQVESRGPTRAHVVPPPPTADNTPPPVAATNPPGRAATEADDRLATGMRETEIHTAVEIDAEAKAAAQAASGTSSPRSSAAARHTPAPLPPVDEYTETGVAPPPTGDDHTASHTLDAHTHDDDASGPSTEVHDIPDMSELDGGTDASVTAPAPDQHTPAPTAHSPHARVPGHTPIPSLHERVPMSTAPASLPPPSADEVAATGPQPACPQCEAPMAWVEEHLRFYCKQCRMYF